jgi:hypothetical protein
MKVTFVIISALAGLAMAAPAEPNVGANADSNVVARQINQPPACFYCDNWFKTCERVRSTSRP